MTDTYEIVTAIKTMTVKMVKTEDEGEIFDMIESIGKGLDILHERIVRFESERDRYRQLWVGHEVMSNEEEILELKRKIKETNK